MPMHVHRNPVTGRTAGPTPWPCPQCIALGRTEPLQYGKDVPDSGGLRGNPIPPDRPGAYLATFPPLEDDEEPLRPRPSEPGSVPQPDRAAARRRGRRKAERQARRKTAELPRRCYS